MWAGWNADGALPALQELSLWDNPGLGGALPASQLSTAMANLTTLYISNNSFDGTILSAAAWLPRLLSILASVVQFQTGRLADILHRAVALQCYVDHSKNLGTACKISFCGAE